jgi:hypothetical protein
MATQVEEMSTEQLEEVLAKRKKKEQAEQEAAKKQYEHDREMLVLSNMAKAKEIAAIIAEFKTHLHNCMEEQQEKLNQYGGINKNSKGGFSITSEDGNFRIRRTRATEPQWDERSTKAIELIKDFLGDTIKKRDKNLYEILISFIARNDKGELEYSRVMGLLQHEARYQDARWVEGLKLIRESYAIHFKGYGYEFQFKNAHGKWERVELNFSAA